VSAPFRHVACFVDDSDAALRGLDEASRLARDGARLSVVHVVAPAPWPAVVGSALGGLTNDPTALTAAVEAWLGALIEGVDGAEAVVLTGHPTEEAVRFLGEAGCDLVVAASHRGMVSRSVLGSFASFLAHHAPCSVLLVPPAAR
jgi:nucleotide-binding universal stress UspA family protein